MYTFLHSVYLNLFVLPFTLLITLKFKLNKISDVAKKKICKNVGIMTTVLSYNL